MQPSVPWRYGQKQPFGSIPRINWAHPLAQGLAFYTYDTGSAILDLVNGVSLTAAGANYTTSTYALGSGTHYLGVTGGAACTYSPTLPVYNTFGSTTAYSFFCGTFFTGAPLAAAIVNIA